MLPTRDRTLGSAGGAQAFSSIKMPTGASAWVGRIFFIWRVGRGNGPFDFQNGDGQIAVMFLF
jgi:hypothetical protein